MCCMSSEPEESRIKRREFSHEGSTASEPNSHQGFCEQSSWNHATAKLSSSPSIQPVQADETQLSTCTAVPRVKYMHRSSCSASVCSLPRVKSLNLMTIEEEPFQPPRITRRTLGTGQRARTISSDEVMAPISFGAMKHYHRFVTRQ